jgi:hypothetical protein
MVWEETMVKNEIHLLQAQSGSWLVTEGRWHPPMRVFRSRAHAIFFACAVAGTRGVEIVVHWPDGSRTRENPPSQEDTKCVLTELLQH